MVIYKKIFTERKPGIEVRKIIQSRVSTDFHLFVSLNLLCSYRSVTTESPVSNTVPAFLTLTDLLTPSGFCRCF